MKKIITTALAGVICGGAYAGVIFSEDFEAVSSLSAPWTWGVINYDSNSVPTGGSYFPGGAPSTGIYAIETGQSGPGQGDNVLKSFGDYGYAPNFDNNQYLDTLLYAEHIITAGEAALGSVSFSFDYKAWPDTEGGIGGVSTANIFVKVVENGGAYATLDFVQFEVTAGDTDWASDSLAGIDISADEGQILQWGTIVRSQNYSPTAIAVDNLSVSAIPEPATLGLLGIFGGFMLFIRRRMKR